MTADNHEHGRPAPLEEADQVLRLAAERGVISSEEAETTLAEVRERLLEAGLYDREESTIHEVLPDHLFEDDTLAQLARELGLDDSDWMPQSPDGEVTPTPLTRKADPFDVFPVKDWERYEFVEFVGRGGMGDVFKARDPRLGRFVALKFLRRDDPDQIKRFTREAKIQAMVEHENLCPVYEVGEIDGHSFIAMQYIAGGSIKEVSSLLDMRQKVQVMVDVADGLHTAHQAGLIHRDIKPANILVERNSDGSWHPFVVDFGIAREVDTPHDLTVTGMVLGTPAFSSPEQVRGESSNLDRRTDIYGIGATLYWFLTGRSPYEGAYQDILSGVSDRDPVPPHRIDRSIPVDLETIVLKCLEKEQDRRYATAREASEDMRRFLGGEPIAARPAGLLYKLGKRIRKYPGLVAAIAIAVLAFSILGVVSLRTNLRTRRQAVVAQHLTERARDIESFARVAAMMPLHDRTQERAVITGQIRAIEEEMSRLGSISAGPGHYALGRAYQSLQDTANARDHLEQAVNEGYGGAGVSYALGLVMGRQYQRELNLAGRLENEELRAARLIEIERELRDPALEHLRSGESGSSVDAPAWAEALIAFYEGRFEQALTATRQAFLDETWRYEAKRLEGDILLEMAAFKRMSGNADEALHDLGEADAAFQFAADIARSDPSIHEGVCALWTQVLDIRSRRGESIVDAFDTAVAACNRSLAIDPERADGHERLSHLHWRWADIVSDRGGNPAPFLEKAIDEAESAIVLDPDSVAAYFTKGGALTVTALGELARGEDPRKTLGLAIASYENAIVIDPGAVLAHDDLGYAWERLARYEMAIGLDPGPSLERAVAAFHKANDLNPNYANAYNNSGIALWRLAVYEYRTGSDPLSTLQQAVSAYDTAIERNPEYAYALANRGLAGRTIAMVLVGKETDPTAAVEGARQDLDRALTLNPQIFWAYPERAAVEILAARWAMRNGDSPEAYFRAATAATSQALAANPQNAVAYQSAAEVHRWRAEWRIQNGRSVRADLIEGQRLIEQALARNPGLANAMVTNASLKTIQAESELDPRIRRALAADAGEDLRLALAANPLLEMENMQLSQRISALNAEMETQ